jgi:23S rRNA pseudouridine1911/1915/1917 synthase
MIKDIIKIKTQEFDIKQRLDKFMSDKIRETNPEISRNRIQSLIAEGALSKNGVIFLDASYKIKNGEEYVLTIPENKPTEIPAKDIAVEVVWEDENMAVINKPAGLTTHPGGGNYDNTLVNALLYKFKDSLSGIGGVERPGIVHRLDKNTSGLMVVAKNDLFHQELSNQIQTRILERKYLALCHGTVKPFSGIINKNIAQDRKDFRKMAVNNDGGKEAVTHYQTKEIFYDGTFSLIECKLETGRTHQIRVHLAHVNHPIIGDPTYGSKKQVRDKEGKIIENIRNFSRQALHSYKISFFHPLLEKRLEFENKMPEDMLKLITPSILKTF